MSGSPAEMVGTTLTGHGWQTYYVTADGEMLVHVGDTATATESPLQLLGRYESADLARAVARFRLRRDVRMASEDMCVAGADIAALIEANHHSTEWSAPPVPETPVTERTTRRSLPGLIRG